MYKVHLFTNETIVTFAKHKLVNVLYKQFSNPKKVTSSANIEPESSDIDYLFKFSMILDIVDISDICNVHSILPVKIMTKFLR